MADSEVAQAGHGALPQGIVLGDGVLAFLTEVEEALPDLQWKAFHFAALGALMSQDQDMAMATALDENRPEGLEEDDEVHRRVLLDFLRQEVDRIDDLEQVSLKKVRAAARKLARIGPVELAGTRFSGAGVYWSCFLLSVLGRCERSKLKEFLADAALEGDDEWLALFVNLTSNSRMEILRFKQSSMANLSFVLCDYVGEALKRNCVLKSLHLDFEDQGPATFQLVKSFMAALTPSDSLVGSDSTSNITIQTLEMQFENFNFLDGYVRPAVSKGVAAVMMSTLSIAGIGIAAVSGALPNGFGIATDTKGIATMISRNSTLTTLTLNDGPFSEREWLYDMIPALKANANLRVLNLKGSVFGHEGPYLAHEQVLNVETVNEYFKAMLQSNRGLEDITLQGTRMDAYAGQFKEILRMNRTYRTKFQEQAEVPATCGRIVLCGYEHAGKTTLASTMVRCTHGTLLDSVFQGWKKAWKRVAITYPRFRACLFGSRAAEELRHRTRGVDIVVLRDTPPRTSLWDFAGQVEYYALHDHVFPDVKNSCFVYVCSATLPPRHDWVTRSHEKMIKPEDMMKEELLYWMRFIASNSESVNVPRLSFVLTNKDTLSELQLRESTRWAKRVVTELGTQFQGRIALEPTVAAVNAHSRKDVEPVMKGVEQSLKQLLETSTEYAVCEYVRDELQKWCAHNSGKPIMHMETFDSKIWKKVREIAGEETWNALTETDLQETVLAYLSEKGDVMFYPGLGFFVVDPRWFGIGVLGSMIDAFTSQGQANGSTREWAGIFGCLLHGGEAHGGLPHDRGFVTREDIEELLNMSLRTLHLRKGMRTGITAEDLIKLMIHLELCFEEKPGSSNSSLFVPTVFDGRDSSGATGSRKWEWKLPPLSGVAPIYFGRRLGCQDVSLTFLTPGFFHRAQVRLRNYLLTDNRVKAVEVDKHLLHFVENGVEVLVEYSGDRDYYVDILVTSSKTFGEAKAFVQKHVVDQLVEFCAGPKGCQGVLLEEFVIKPTCVRGLDVLEDRKDKALKVSFLQQKVTEDQGYQCHWKVDDRDMLETDYAIDLLEGPGTYRQQGNDPTLADHTPAADIAAELPRNLYFKADENWLTSIISKGDYGPVMAIRLYAKCDEGVHVVDSQAGRPLQVRGGDNIQLVKHGVTLARLVVNVAAGVVPGAKSVGDGVDSILKNVEKRITPPHEFPISLEKLLSQFLKTGQLASTRDVIFALEEYVVTEDIKRWLSRFLDVNGGDIAFRDHFKLWKARRTQDQVVVWVCDECHRRGIRSRTLR